MKSLRSKYYQKYWQSKSAHTDRMLLKANELAIKTEIR
jgi:hypothetical protein